ncbi:MAG: DUF1028 domain-containing protein [Bacteroidota bacterium]
MKNILTAALLLPFSLMGQDTFSICAVDTVTGEVGSAGASCIDASAIPGGVVIISDVHNGRGVIHTQSYWLAANQNYASSLMTAGLSPQQIIDSLVANDAQNNPAIRQYGAVDLYNGSARVAAYTGANCFNYKNHIIGPNYAIQGNILLGQQILDSMEARFLNTPGDLACKLMAALQGAKVVGADTRCTSSGNSSLSSFLRVACPNDPQGTYSIDLVVPQGPSGFEPIDSLQTLFNNIHNCSVPLVCLTSVNQPSSDANGFSVSIVPNPSSGSAILQVQGQGSGFSLLIYNNHGQLVRQEDLGAKKETKISNAELGKGVYFYKVISAEGACVYGKILFL